MYTLGLIAAGIVFIVGVNVWAEGHTREVNEAAVAYEQCVQTEYHMTPIKWYEENGKYPLCGN